MRLAGIELRNFRCFENLSLELDETTIIVGANDTGKSTVLEAIHWLLEPSEIDWKDAIRDRGRPAEIVGRFVDLPERDAEAIEPFVQDGSLRVGLSSASGIDRWLVVTADQATRIRELIDPESAAEANAAGTVPPGFESGAPDVGAAGSEVWYWWWIWEFGEGWGVLDVWASQWSGLGPLRAIRLGTSSEASWDPLAVLQPILQRHLAGEFDPELAKARGGLSRIATSTC